MRHFSISETGWLVTLKTWKKNLEWGKKLENPVDNLEVARESLFRSAISPLIRKKRAKFSHSTAPQKRN